MTALATRAIMAALTLIYALVAMVSCSVTTQPLEVELAVQDIPQESTVRTLRILSAREEDSYALQQAADRFCETRPGITVQVQTIGEESDYRAALRARLISGEQAVDLFHIYGRQDMMELLPYLRDLSGLGWVEEARGGVLEAVRAEGAVYGVPYSLEGMGLLVNRDILDAAGLSAENVDSMEALEEMLDALREGINSGELEEAFPELEAAAAFPALNTAAGERLADLLLTGEFATQEQAVAANGVSLPMAEAVGMYVDLMARYAAGGRGWATLNETAETAGTEALAAGRVAVMQGSTALWGEIARRDPELAARLRLLPIPLEEETDGVVYLEAPVYWAVHTGAEDASAALALEFLAWLYQSETGCAFFAQEFAALSAYGEGAGTGISLHTQLLAYLGAGRTVPRLYREAPAGWTGEALQQLQEYFSVYDKSWEQVADALRQGWTDLRLGG